MASGDHHVHFFETDERLGAVVAGHLGAAMLDGGVAVVLATPAHRQLFTTALAAAGVDVDAAVDEGRLQLRDAAEALASFSSDGVVDPGRFEKVVGGIVREAGATGRRVEVYGEIVALLWDAGDVPGAMTLEDLWNRLSQTLAFTLFCAYPSRFFQDAVGAESFAQVCHHHAGVVHGAPAPPHAEVSRRFPSASVTSRLARRFVKDTLQEWGWAELTDDAVLVVAELATNAVNHAGSDVCVGLARGGGGVRVLVGDASPVAPLARVVEATSPNGRGLRIVADVAHDWGHDVVDGGKLVWADLVVRADV